MLRAIKSLFQKKPAFEKRIERLWLCGRWVNAKQGKLDCLMPYFDYSILKKYGGRGEYVEHKLGSVVPVNFDQDERWVAFYKITRIERYRMGDDVAGYDDGKDYTLELVAVKRISIEQFDQILQKVSPDRDCPECDGRKRCWIEDELKDCQVCGGTGRVWCKEFPCR